jgi:Phosphoribosyl transferase/TRSP domain C terminus to PRTase_2
MRNATQQAGHGDFYHSTIPLPTGELQVEVAASDIPLYFLCDYAARRNPKRGFLFVSKVLGKHIPVKPYIMRSVHALLAAKIPADLPGPVVVVGMAETAICLGHGVYDQYTRITGRQDVLFSHSTRYRVDRPVAVEFLEEHSHAAEHIMYLPENEHDRELYLNARSIVLVDDEASTGKTFVNLARAFHKRIPSLENVVTAVITDWRGFDRTEQNRVAMPVRSSSIAVLEGQYEFTPAPNLVMLKMPDVVGNGGFKDHLIRRNYGRLGLRGSDAVAAAVSPKMLAAVASKGGRVLVLGTGEFAYPPFRFAEELEALGVDVYFQTTTRSPIMVGGAIETALAFDDNYGDGIPNFLYNVAPGQYDQVIIVHETPAGTVDPALVGQLGAQTMEL